MTHRSRFTLWIVEAILALNVLYLSGYPLIKTSLAGSGDYNVSGLADGLQTFLTGAGPYTASFWLRILSVVAGIVILATWPRKNAPKKYLRSRVYADLTLFILYFYVCILSLIYSDSSNYFWIQPLVYSALMGVAYMSNSWRLSNGGH